ncbi:fatty acid--CoA ligase family protein [Peribacillus muralis]|uniref:fatty acid--CoA ligase family protein n=1 Tax=Peribacillus muralis TaxID=264697 RepID=UPI001F4EBE71|nr:fatty acid--CoA ligase family protein [Peribacillus muralis]MCK1992911.1 fatty acid--CoA ligase family protein [Peribacillus muralis]MCK2013466.1 fatty acid--CoA ligase family protein [Peribacillus muralis]
MNLSEKLHHMASRQADKPAYYFMDRSTSYGELDKAVTKFADELHKLGVSKGDNVALVLGNSPHFIISLYGAIRAGATVIPVNPIYTPDEIGYLLNNGDVKVVVALDKLVPLFEKMNSILSHVDYYVFCETELHTGDSSELSIYPKMKSFTNMIENGNASFEGPELGPDDTAIILYTSGTTGKPKGAMLSHTNIYSNATDVGEYLKITENDRVVTTLPMFHVFSLTVVVNAPLLQGATLLIVPQFSPKEIFRQIKKYDATVFAGVPTMYNFLFQYPDGQKDDLRTLRICISGGSAMPVSLLESFEQKFNVRVSEGYGLSEASPVTCFNPLDRPRKAGSIGTSILRVENKIVNELGEEVSTNGVGELIVRGPNVMKGYYKMPEESAAVLKDGWLYTGDLARMDNEGYFFIVDRKKELIIVGGYNVYPREVEEILYAHPEVVEAAAIGMPDPNQGEVVHCFVVKKNDALTEEDLLDYCLEHLAKYKVPEKIEFLDELPKNTTGKILRRSLKTHVIQN